MDFTTAAASHFSEYALSSPTNADAPAIPTGFAVSDSGTTATLTWAANTESDLSGYFIYRDTIAAGSFPQLAQVGAVTTYSSTGLTAGQTYYYKISAFDTASNESAASASKYVTIAPSSGGSSSGGGASGGGGGGVSLASTPTTAIVSAPTPVITSAPLAVSVPAASSAKPSAAAVAVSPVFNSDLEPGMRGDEVRRLQELLRQDPEIYPDGIVSGYFGPLTVQAVKKFQEKYGLPAPGRVGPQTRIKLQEAFRFPPSVPENSVIPFSPVSNEERIKEIQEKIRMLQEQIQKLTR